MCRFISPLSDKGKRKQKNPPPYVPGENMNPQEIKPENNAAMRIIPTHMATILNTNFTKLLTVFSSGLNQYGTLYLYKVKISIIFFQHCLHSCLKSVLYFMWIGDAQVSVCIECYKVFIKYILLIIL